MDPSRPGLVGMHPSNLSLSRGICVTVAIIVHFIVIILMSGHSGDSIAFYHEKSKAFP
jgi:hypothetical protein